MRCPGCAGEVLAGSRFCGICGRTLANEGTGAGVGGPAALGMAGGGVSVGAPSAIDPGSMSLFELPVSRGARTARIALVLVLDALLAGAGIFLTMAYLDAREAVPALPPAPPALERRATIEADRPVVVPPDSPAPGPTSPAPTAPSARPTAPAPTSSSPSPQPTSPSPQPSPQPRPSAVADAGTEAPIEVPSAPSADAAPTPSEGRDEAEAGNLAEALALVVASHDAQLQRCYERAAKATSTAEPLEGTIVLHFTLVPGGRLERVSAEKNETGSPQLAACVVALAEGWTVAPGPTAPLAFEWPFRFRAGGAR